MHKTPKQPGEDNHILHPHVGMRKLKSLLALFLGFWTWQLIRLIVPGLEVHPTFIYIYGVIEIRETSDKTKDLGGLRIRATLTAILVGLPFVLLYDGLKPLLGQGWLLSGAELAILLAGVLAVLVVAEQVKCRSFCGLAAIIFVLLALRHFEDSMYLYSILRVSQTLIAVGIAWVLNVKLFPYPPAPGSLSHWWLNRRKKQRNAEEN